MKLETFQHQLEHLQQQTETLAKTLGDVRRSLALFNPWSDPPERAQLVKDSLLKILRDVEEEYCGPVGRWCEEWIGGIEDVKRRGN